MDGWIQLCREDGSKKKLPLLSAAMHYFRIEPLHQAACLDSIRALGFPIVETYVPWQVHEQQDGGFQFKSLLDFIQLAQEKGLHVILRPGPHVNGEMTHFGLPERIVNDPACQALGANGTPVLQFFPPKMFPIPSMASRAFRQESARWLSVFAEAIKPHAYPQGPVIAVQVDNEAAYYFREDVYDQDYHPDAIELWKAYRQDSEESTATHFPVGFEDLLDEEASPETLRRATRKRIQWTQFKEWLLLDYLNALKQALVEGGLGSLLFTHNLPLGEMGGTLSLSDLEETLDVAGLDFYHGRHEAEVIRNRALFATGSSRYAYSPEMGMGAPFWFAPLGKEDSLYCTVLALAFGIRSFNQYMTVERDRWHGALIDIHGNMRMHAAPWKTLIHRLKECEFSTLRFRHNVCVVMPKEYKHWTLATHMMGPFSASGTNMLLKDPTLFTVKTNLGYEASIQRDWYIWITRIQKELQKRKISYVLSDAHHLPQAQVLFVPTFEAVDESRFKLLATHSAQTIVTGPAWPKMNMEGERTLFVVPNHIRKLETLAPDALQEMFDALSLDPFWTLEQGEGESGIAPGALELTFHDDHEGLKVLFVLNLSKDPLQARVKLHEQVLMEETFTHEKIDTRNTIEIKLEAYGFKMFVRTSFTGGAA